MSTYLNDLFFKPSRAKLIQAYGRNVFEKSFKSLSFNSPQFLVWIRVLHQEYTKITCSKISCFGLILITRTYNAFIRLVTAGKVYGWMYAPAYIERNISFFLFLSARSVQTSARGLTMGNGTALYQLHQTYKL